MNVDTILENQLKKNVPHLRSGQVVRVHERIQEGGKERTQIFEGLIIAVKHGSGLDGTFTVRKIASWNVGVERVFPLHLPTIVKIEVLRQEKVRRAKLYFVREQLHKKTKKRKTTLVNKVFELQEEEELHEEGEEAVEEAPSQDVDGQEQPQEAESEVETPAEDAGVEKDSKSADNKQEEGQKGA
jgi:large subunit ribosomal protein L19